ncbi:MAG: type I restriction endonuclease subunit R [Acetobacter sp.]|nr:type I restriction endonuclease subunit R [Acetobacter sp.]
MNTYQAIADMPETAIVAVYEPSPTQATHYQSEAELEAEFIRLLQENGYAYVSINNAKELLHNVREQLSQLNNVTFSEEEWQRFCREYLLSNPQGIQDTSCKIQRDSKYYFTFDNGHAQNIMIIDKNKIHRNTLQVINQYEAQGAKTNRYDVTILVNGLPLVHVELKRRGVSLHEAFNQINRYQRESFWAEAGLFEFVQIFVISNGTHTKYYSNSTRHNSVKNNTNNSGNDQAMREAVHNENAGNSFEFTSWWADGRNKHIADLVDFSKTFFLKHVLLTILTRYCVFDTDKNLKIMRPYQIAATEKILEKIKTAHLNKQWGSPEAGGYIWHTTGSGKTLTSFKTAQLAKDLPCIEKVLFVVDRKDLDYQTQKEYNQFEEGSVDSTLNTRELLKKLHNPEAKIIVTTIQKLSRALERLKDYETDYETGYNVLQSPIVIIFDECHRSQFGKMHRDIIRKFKKYYLFGFTGTPIFEDNASTTNALHRQTTEHIFGRQLHSYTIVNAIEDKNVLPFLIDYVGTMKAKSKSDDRDKKIKAVDVQHALLAPERIQEITHYIVQYFDNKTKNRAFNAILATSSIDMAQRYYDAFKAYYEEHIVKNPLKIALIYSFGAQETEDNDEDLNKRTPGTSEASTLESEKQEIYEAQETNEGEGVEILDNTDNEGVGTIPEENLDPTRLSASSRIFLDGVIKDYNAYFGTNFSAATSEKFDQYYQDVSKKVKTREIDLLIVVDMFLTGFDSKTLNTLWVDKNLKYHGLIQAFSRTNRILNSVKTYGNVVCFRPLEDNVKKALAIFGEDHSQNVKDIEEIAVLPGYQHYLEDYAQCVTELQDKFPRAEGDPLGETAEKDFVKIFGKLLRLRNVLEAFPEFIEKEKTQDRGEQQKTEHTLTSETERIIGIDSASEDDIKDIIKDEDTKNTFLSERALQDYKSVYQNIREKYRRSKEHEQENINDDLLFEIELIKSVEVNIDYILELLAQGHKILCSQNPEEEDKKQEVLQNVFRVMGATYNLRSKRKLVEQFVKNFSVSAQNLSQNKTNEAIKETWSTFVKNQYTQELDAIIDEEKLQPERTRQFMEDALQDGFLKTTGTNFNQILPKMSPFSKNTREREKTISNRLQDFFEKYHGAYNPNPVNPL